MWRHLKTTHSFLTGNAVRLTLSNLKFCFFDILKPVKSLRLPLFFRWKKRAGSGAIFLTTCSNSRASFLKSVFWDENENSIYFLYSIKDWGLYFFGSNSRTWPILDRNPVEPEKKWSRVCFGLLKSSKLGLFRVGLFCYYIKMNESNALSIYSFFC